jgi:SAM-dependent methyltransferase
VKARDSGMPEELYWAGFFDAHAALEGLAGDTGLGGDVLEFGCGYGTFTLPAARRAAGLVTALDIDPLMVARVKQRAEDEGLTNIRAEVRDFIADGAGVPSGSQAHAMIYNLLHLEGPVALLREAHRTLRPGGVLSVIHWRSDIPTPRGPSLSIRPRPRQCEAWLREVGFTTVKRVDLQHCCPYHFGLIAVR